MSFVFIIINGHSLCIMLLLFLPLWLTFTHITHWSLHCSYCVFCNIDSLALCNHQILIAPLHGFKSLRGFSLIRADYRIINVPHLQGTVVLLLSTEYLIDMEAIYFACQWRIVQKCVNEKWHLFIPNKFAQITDIFVFLLHCSTQGLKSKTTNQVNCVSRSVLSYANSKKKMFVFAQKITANQSIECCSVSLYCQKHDYFPQERKQDRLTKSHHDIYKTKRSHAMSN